MINRRRYISVIATSGAIVVSGCTSFQDIEDIQVINNTNKTQNYTVTVTRKSTDKVVLEENTEIGPSEEIRYQNPITEHGMYRISFETNNGSTGEHTWEFDDEYVALVIRIHASEISFERLDA